MSHGNEVKESIVLLCRMFKYGNIFQKITPEHIRQAKFDKPEAISILREFLFKLLHGKDMQDTDSERQLQEHLKVLRYPRLTYLYNEHGEFHSSREMLLVLAWYIHISKTTNAICNKALQPISIAKILSKTLPDCENEALWDSSGLSMSDKANYLAWLVSRIRFLMMQISSLEGRNIKITYKTVETTREDIQSSPSLLLLLRNPESVSKYEKQLERKILLLQTCTKWKTLKSVFWSWMDSVLASALNKKYERTEEGDDDKILNCASDVEKNSLKIAVRKKLDELQEELDKQEKINEHKWKQNTVSASLQPEQKSDIDREIAMMKLKLEDPYHTPVLKPSKASVDNSHIDGFGHTRDLNVSIKWECERLRSVNALLEEELMQLRLAANEKLTALSQRLPDLVMIPHVVQKRKNGKKLQ